MKKLIAGAAMLLASGQVMSKLGARKNVEKGKAYSKNVDEEKLNRNITVAKDRLSDPTLTVCQRQEYQKTLDHLEENQK